MQITNLGSNTQQLRRPAETILAQSAEQIEKYETEVFSDWLLLLFLSTNGGFKFFRM
jgi:hypothetical protein